jgi:hypothetical protein
VITIRRRRLIGSVRGLAASANPTRVRWLTMSEIDWDALRLVTARHEANSRLAVPYSQFPAADNDETVDGPGANVENASYGLTRLCAECALRHCST